MNGKLLNTATTPSMTWLVIKYKIGVNNAFVTTSWAKNVVSLKPTGMTKLVVKYNIGLYKGYINNNMGNIRESLTTTNKTRLVKWFKIGMIRKKWSLRVYSSSIRCHTTDNQWECIHKGMDKNLLIATGRTAATNFSATSLGHHCWSKRGGGLWTVAN